MNRHYFRSAVCLGSVLTIWMCPGMMEAQVTNNSGIPDYSNIVSDTASAMTNTAPRPLPIDYTKTVPAPPPLGTSQLAEAPPATEAPPVPLLQWGPVQFQPHVYYRLTYEDGIHARPGESTTTWINEIAPGILLGLGQHWSLDYTPTLRYYSSSAFANTWDNSVKFFGGTSYEDWVFGLTQAYSDTSQPLVETGTQTYQEFFLTGLSAVYRMNTKMSLEFGANQNFRFMQKSSANEFTDYRSWSTMDWLNYQFNPRFAAAGGVGFTYDNVSQGSDMTSEQVQGRVSWKPSDKFDLTGTAGIDIRQFLDSGLSGETTPIFTLTAAYHLFETTTLSLNASRIVTPSYYSGQISENTSLSIALSQRLLGKLTLTVSGGIGKNHYVATVVGPLAAPVTDYDRAFLNTRVSTPFLKRGSLGVFYQWNSNTSTSSLYEYNSNQAGLDLSYRF